MSSEKIRSFKGQDYEALKAQSSAENLFEDPEFPAAIESLYYRQDQLQAENKKTLRGIKWLRPKEACENPEFIVNGFDRCDVAQGDIGDCWLMSGMVGMAQKPNKIAKVVPENQSFNENYCGIFHFRFWQYGEWFDVVVDDRLPYYYDEDDENKLKFLYCSSEKTPNEYWSALLEKAYAKLHGSYQALDGGEVYEGITDMSGGISIEFDIRELRSAEEEKFWPFLKKQFKKDTIIGCAIETDGYKELQNGLINGHAYTVTNVMELHRKKLIRVRNPYGGDGEWNGAWSDESKKWNSLNEEEKAKVELVKSEDGEFWMSYSDFIKNWDFITICHLSVSSYEDSIIDSERENASPYWWVTQFHCAWTPESNAGGATETYWKNPQFLIQLQPTAGRRASARSAKKEAETKGTVIVSLMQKNSRLKRTLTKAKEDVDCMEEIHFKLFKINDGVDVEPKKSSGFKFESSQLTKVGTSGDYFNVSEVTKRFRITAGNYLIVPSAKEADKQAEFLVRVFTHSLNASGCELAANLEGINYEYKGDDKETVDEEDKDYEEDEDEEYEDEDDGEEEE